MGTNNMFGKIESSSYINPNQEHLIALKYIENGFLIAELPNDGKGKEDAKRIVEAWNNYDDLVKALKAASVALVAKEMGESYKGTVSFIDKVLKNIVH